MKKQRSGAHLGRVRPGSGVRAVQIQRTSGGNEVNDGGLVRTNSRGYFTAKRRSKSATYLFLAYQDAAATQLIGRSRVAKALK